MQFTQPTGGPIGRGRRGAFKFQLT
jgi:hypothetical protein